MTEHSSSTTAGLLAGVRVIDLSRYLPGPFCTLNLAWLGAEVTVVERAPGDPMRFVPPFGPNGVSLASSSLLRGKTSVIVDMGSDEGMAQVLALVDEADVVVESFRPGVAAKLGVGYEALRERRPQLVYCSLSGYGQDGPWSQRAGHDSNYEAVAGLLARTGPAERPVLPPLPMADLAGGSFAATAICAALVRAARTGDGAHLDISLTEAALALQAHTMPAAHTEDARREEGMLTGGLACYSLYRCAGDTWIAVAPVEPKFFGRLCELVGRPDLAIMQFETTAQERVRRGLAEVFATRSATEWDQLLAAEETCVTRILAPGEEHTNEQLAARCALVQLFEGEEGNWVPRSPFVVDGERTDATWPDVASAAPAG